MISTALATRLRQTAVLLVAVGGSWMAPAATAADQTVDQVEVFSFTKLLRLKFDVTPTQLVGLTAAPTSTLRACQSTAINGLICLDGQVVRQWSTTIEHPIYPVGSITPAAGTALFSCSDTAFAFKAGNPCTTMTVDSKGGIWVAGQKPTNLYSLMQVVKKDGASCPAAAPFTPPFGLLNQSTGYCFRERATGRLKITDLSPVEGSLVEQYFTQGEGVLGVEGGTTVVFYPYDLSSPVSFGGWAEVVQSATIFQRHESPNLKTYLLIAGVSGKVYARDLTPPGPPVTQLFVHANSNTDSLALPRGLACSGGLFANQFRVRSSETSGRVFVTNRNYCLAHVLTPGLNMSGLLASESISTTSLSGAYPPEGLSVAPGIAVNVAQCTTGSLQTGGCPLIADSNDSNQYPALRMYQVDLEPGSPTGLRIFKVEGLPDCRYLLQLPSPPAACLVPGVVINDPKLGDGTQSFPQRQFLNVTPLLPSNVTDVFDASGKKPTGLPRLLIQPRYRARASDGYYFDAIFGVADPNIRFRETFTVEFDISDPNLAGTALGCGVHQKDGNGDPAPLPFTQWDIGTVVSERYSSVGGPSGIVKDTTNIFGQPVPAEHVDTMINKGCYNPTPKAGTRWSMYSYDMELAEDTPIKSSPSGPVTSFAYARAVTYLGNLLLSLHTELGAAQKKLACGNVDAIGNTGGLAGTPLSSLTCDDLDDLWTTAQSSMTSCASASSTAPPPITATAYPAVCNTFLADFTVYKAEVEAAAAGINGSGATVDPANRAGELWSRTDVIMHVFNDHFLPAWGFGSAVDAP